jgi:integrase
LPKYDIAKVPVMKAIEDEDIELFVRLAPKHAKAYVQTVFATGLRGGELLFVKRTPPDYRDRLGTGLCLEKGKEHIYLGKTKDGSPVLRWLSDELADALREYLKGRTDKHDTLFLTHRGVPYKKPWRQRGALCKTMWKSLTKRVAEELQKQAVQARETRDIEGADALSSRAERCLRVGGHWGRHGMVTKGVKLGYSDLKIMQLTGHKSSRLLRRYTHIDEKAGKKLANEVAGNLDKGSTSPSRVDTSKKPRRRRQS